MTDALPGPSNRGPGSGPAEHPSLRGPLLRFRVMAYVTGVLLIVLVFVAMPLKYLAGNPAPVAIVGVLHGWLYMLYLVTAFQITFRLRWPPQRMLLVLLAGTIPFASFVAERRVTSAAIRPSQGPASAGPTDGGEGQRPSATDPARR